MDADLLLYITPDVLPENSNLKDKTVWVVGASSGIGAQISNDLCKLGANVILSSRRENKLLKVVELCKESNSKYTPSIELLDVSDHEVSMYV